MEHFHQQPGECVRRTAVDGKSSWDLDPLHSSVLKTTSLLLLTFLPALEAVIENGGIFLHWLNRAVLPSLQSGVNNFFHFHYPLRLASGE